MHLYIKTKIDTSASACTSPQKHTFSPKSICSSHKTFSHFLFNSTSQGSALSVAFLRTPGLVAGVPTEVEAGAEANRFPQDPAITRVRNFTLTRCRPSLTKTIQDPLNPLHTPVRKSTK